jgi:hypothetical protein
MKIEMTPAEAMAIYDELTVVLLRYARESDDPADDYLTLVNAYNKMRSVIIGHTANIDAFEKWYAIQHEKVVTMDSVKQSQDPV